MSLHFSKEPQPSPKGRGDDNHGAKGQFMTVCSITLPLCIIAVMLAVENRLWANDQPWIEIIEYSQNEMVSPLLIAAIA